MKHYVLTLLLVLFCNNAFAENTKSLLDTLPFGIEIGKTKASEIESKGVCKSKIKIKDNYFRCETYDISGKFIVHMSQNETVNELRWGSDSYGNHHKLPRLWNRAGLKMKMPKEDFIKTIKKLGAKYVKEKDEGLGDFKITFETNKYSYEADFHIYKSMVQNMYLSVFELY